MKKVFGLEEGKRSERKIVRECDLRMRYVEKSDQPSNEKSVGCTHCELSADVGSGRSESGGGSTGGKHLDVVIYGRGSTVGRLGGRTDAPKPLLLVRT